MTKKLLFLITIGLLTSTQAAELKGKIISIADGDTATLLVLENQSKLLKPLEKEKVNIKTQYRIRLNDIDAPEKSQAFGNKSKQNLSKYIFGKDVTVIYDKKDQYGRILGTIYLNNKDINLKQVEDGFAWVYRQYSKKKKYLKAEKEARNLKKGLWADTNPIEPWNYRRKSKWKI